MSERKKRQSTILIEGGRRPDLAQAGGVVTLVGEKLFGRIQNGGAAPDRVALAFDRGGHFGLLMACLLTSKLRIGLETVKRPPVPSRSPDCHGGIRSPGTSRSGSGTPIPVLSNLRSTYQGATLQ